jgi:hypothetical protein
LEAIEWQDVKLMRLMQNDVNIAFGEMDSGAIVGRSSADGCLACCERLPGRFSTIDRQNMCVSQMLIFARICS